ncbi:MAG: DUF4351 domain-containing protein [Planctomycetota bacterium]|nr:DUF4351 domain-containing protein [Planctomycetota bacterium]
MPGGLEQYRPRLRYLLLEERRYRDEELTPMRNLVAALFRLENSWGVADIDGAIEALMVCLPAGAETDDLSRAFTGWIQRVVLRWLSGVKIPELENLQEVRTMLAERAEQWTRQWKEEGRQEGRQGGEAGLLLRQLERKFGPLEAVVRERITRADAERLLVWGERVLTADRLEDVIG